MKTRQSPTPAILYMAMAILVGCGPSATQPSPSTRMTSATLAPIDLHLTIRCDQNSCSEQGQPYLRRWLSELKAELEFGLGINLVEESIEGVTPQLELYISDLPPGPRSTISEQFSAIYLDSKVRLLLHGLDLRHRGPHSLPRDLQAAMQAIATTFGALPACRNTPMSPGLSYHGILKRRARWSATNQTIVRLHAGAGLPQPGRHFDHMKGSLARNVLRVLEGAHEHLPCQAHRAIPRRRALLTAFLTGLNPPAQLLPEAAKGPDAKVLPPSIGKGLEALKNGEPEQALDHCVKDALSVPESGAALCAARAKEALEHHADAQIFYRAHLAYHPDDGEAMVSLARLVGRDGDDASARALLHMAVKWSPELLEARMNLGIALARLGDYTGATAQWERVLELNPGHNQARQLLRELTEYRDRHP